MDEHDELTITFNDLLDGPSAVLVGNRVILDDLEGNQAEGLVKDIEDDLIDVVVDLATWRSNREERLSGWSHASFTSRVPQLA
ncbi:hypothetical protein [Microbacterium sp. Root180]|uniref:hypothetical protein n=1 Tax=Microbacterium sp. Root180 TaxID=1736483 RepID=UPI0006F587D2|nr:hypothetical protein [Microbacterium sp. Root180]KRB38815.1 hypothetical protein ASD93_02425 [Microbacterium sp. Root180]